VWQTSGPATVSDLMLAMLLQIANTNWSAVGYIANALDPPFLRRTASDDMPNMRTASFSYTSFLSFALLCQGRHKLLDDGDGHLRRRDMTKCTHSRGNFVISSAMSVNKCEIATFQP
jgi:hypothetical protein